MTVASYDPDDDGYGLDEYEPWDDDDPDCTLCAGEGYAECNDPIQCMERHIGGGEYPLCPCIGCGGSGLARDQRIW